MFDKVSQIHVFDVAFTVLLLRFRLRYIILHTFRSNFPVSLRSDWHMEWHQCYYFSTAEIPMHFIEKNLILLDSLVESLHNNTRETHRMRVIYSCNFLKSGARCEVESWHHHNIPTFLKSILGWAIFSHFQDWIILGSTKSMRDA